MSKVPPHKLLIININYILKLVRALTENSIDVKLFSH